MFVHLHCHSPFSFLDGVASLESMAARAAMLGMPALALTDHNTIAGLPSFHKWASVYGIKPISGAEITLEDDSHLTLLAENSVGYTNLCRLLTFAHDGEARRRAPFLSEALLFEYCEGLIVLSGCRQGKIARLLLHRQDERARTTAEYYRNRLEDSFFIELNADAYPQSESLMRRLADLAGALQIPIVGTSNVHHVTPDEYPIYDILSCMRVGCDIRTPHAQRPLNNSRWLHGFEEAERRFAMYPEAISNTLRIAQRCEVVVKLHAALFPAYSLPAGRPSASAYLRQLVYDGASKRYRKLDEPLRNRLEHELAIIEQLGYADYFLVVWDIVHFAREQRIRCAGRGSAADSAVAYCLYITDVDAAGRGLLFERFMSLERAEKPDIDVDFDSRRRDEVIQYVYRQYGEKHVARVATYQTFRGRSAIREVGEVLGLPLPLLDLLAKRVPWMAHADRLVELFDRLPELREFSAYRHQLEWLWQLAAQIAGFPRHFGMHVGGVVVSKRPLFEVTSLQPSAKGEWMTPFDKDAAEDVGLVKLDLLSLRTMSAIEDAVVLRERQGKALDYDQIPFDDAKTFEMLGQGETIGVFQLESPAQRTLQSRLQANGLEDIVASVALIRPGPIKGNMVDPFLARRHGQEPISYLHPKLEPILGKTYGVVLFQEQVIEIATAIANFTPGEADKLRRVMSHARSAKEMEQIGQHFMEKASEAGVDKDVAATIFSYIQGYASYGFCEAHAAAFAATAYKTAYLVRHYPAEFYAAILNQYPMGYYPVHVICAQVRKLGIRLLKVDVNESEWQCFVTKEGGKPAIRLGFCLVKGFSKDTAAALCEARTTFGNFNSVLDCLRRVPVLDRLTCERLIRIGGFDSLRPVERKAMLWQLPSQLALRRVPKESLFATNPLTALDSNDLADFEMQDFTLSAKLSDEYNYLGVGVSGHWMDLFRSYLAHAGYQTTAQLTGAADGCHFMTAGLLVRPHRPPTKSGKTVVFFTLEDETGFMDATMFEAVYHASGSILFTPYGRLIGVEGRVQRKDSTRAQFIVTQVWPLVSAIPK